jgi:hypothetical protein
LLRQRVTAHPRQRFDCALTGCRARSPRTAASTGTAGLPTVPGPLLFSPPYLKALGREKVGSLAGPAEGDSFLNRWLLEYTNPLELHT